MRTFVGSSLSIALACLAVGCTQPVSNQTLGNDDADSEITSQELAAGASWDGEEEGDEPDDAATDADAEESLSDAYADDSNSSAVTGCTNVRGYRHGHPQAICVTKVDGHLVEQRTAGHFRVLQEAARRDGVDLHVVSGWRSMAKQRSLYRDYLAGRGNLAAPPGFSNHQSGHALDLNDSARGVHAWLVANAADYGFRRTVPSERWHYED